MARRSSSAKWSASAYLDTPSDSNKWLLGLYSEEICIFTTSSSGSGSAHGAPGRVSLNEVAVRNMGVGMGHLALRCATTDPSLNPSEHQLPRRENGDDDHAYFTGLL